MHYSLNSNTVQFKKLIFFIMILLKKLAIIMSSSNHNNQINGMTGRKKVLGMRKLKQLYWQLYELRNAPNDGFWSFTVSNKCFEIINQSINGSLIESANGDKKEITFKYNETFYQSGDRVILTFPLAGEILSDMKTDTAKATIFIFYALQKLVILERNDTEIITKFRDSQLKCISSFRHSKQAIILDLFEFSVVQIDGADLTINPIVSSTSSKQEELK